MKLPLSLDVLLLLLLVPAHMQMQEGERYLLAVPLLFYILLEFWHPLRPYSALPERYGKARIAFLLRLLLLLVMITSASLVPIVWNIGLRLQADAGEADFLEAYYTIHDGAIQTEDALRYLEEGKNPYLEDYEDTLLFLYGPGETPINPAIYHYVYLPGLFLISWPFRFLSLDLLGFYDQRIVCMFIYSAMVLILPLLATSPERKLSLLAAVGLNPLLVGSVIIGMNDVIVLLSVLTAAVLLSRKRLLFSGLVLGLGCAIKATTWLFIPFYLALLLTFPLQRNQLARLAKPTSMILLMMGLILGPFLVWDARAFVDDTLLYLAGKTSTSYPIRGYTLGRLLVALRIISSPLDAFPFWILQVMLGIPLLFLLLRYQMAQNDIGRMLHCAGLFFLGIGFLSRFFHDNYVGLVTAMMTAGALFEGQARSDEA